MEFEKTKKKKKKEEEEEEKKIQLKKIEFSLGIPWQSTG